MTPSITSVEPQSSKSPDLPCLWSACSDNIIRFSYLVGKPLDGPNHAITPIASNLLFSSGAWPAKLVSRESLLSVSDFQDLGPRCFARSSHLGDFLSEVVRSDDVRLSAQRSANGRSGLGRIAH
jgi:hypothetical protein